MYYFRVRRDWQSLNDLLESLFEVRTTVWKVLSFKECFPTLWLLQSTYKKSLFEIGVLDMGALSVSTHYFSKTRSINGLTLSIDSFSDASNILFMPLSLKRPFTLSEQSWLETSTRNHYQHLEILTFAANKFAALKTFCFDLTALFPFCSQNRWRYFIITIKNSASGFFEKVWIDQLQTKLRLIAKLFVHR